MISIDVSNKKIYIAEITGKDQAMSVVGFEEIPVGEAVVLDNTLNEELLSSLLKLPLAKYKSRDVAITFSTLPIVSSAVVLPKITNKSQQAEAVNSKVFTTLSHEEFVANYKILKEFSDDEGGKTSIMAYVIPRQIAYGAWRVITALGKTPKGLYISEDAINSFADRFCKEQSLLMANVSEEIITLHLINKPEAIITRTSILEKQNTADVLGMITGVDTSVQGQLIAQISKIVQYQAIKYAGAPIESIYLMGSQVESDFASAIEAEFSVKTMMIGDGSLPFKKQGMQVEQLCYCIGCAI